MPKGYENYQLPRELAVYVKYIEDLRLHGYTSEMEFVKDAVRRRVEELQTLKMVPAFVNPNDVKDRRDRFPPESSGRP